MKPGAQEKVLTLWATSDGSISVNDSDGHQVALIDTDLDHDQGPLVTAGLVGELVKHKVRLYLEESRDASEAILRDNGINTTGMP